MQVVDLSTARMHSQKELVRGIEREFNIQISDKLESQSTTDFNGDKSEFSGKDIYSLNIESSDNVSIYYEKVDEYYQIEKVGGHSIFRLYVLYAVAKPNVKRPQFDDFTISNRYGASAIARSIVPGWAQIYKGSPTKGYCIMGATVAGVAGIVVCENLRSSYIRKISEQPKNALYYSQQADNWENGRNIAIGATAAIYVYNIIDAIAAKGAKRVIVKKRNTSYSAVPTIMSNGSAGLMVSVNF